MEGGLTEAGKIRQISPGFDQTFQGSILHPHAVTFAKMTLFLFEVLNHINLGQALVCHKPISLYESSGQSVKLFEAPR